MAPQRTRIVDGEIVREDDIPVRQGEAAPRQAGGATAAHHQTPSLIQSSTQAGRGQAAFNFSVVPVALHREPEDQSFFGLPGLKIFGAHFQSKHLIALVAATLFLGWKGFALGLAVWIFYKMSQKPAVPAPGGGVGSAAAFLQQYMQQAPAGQREYRSGTGPLPGRLGQQAVSGQRPGHNWAGRGQGHRLGTAPAPSQ